MKTETPLGLSACNISKKKVLFVRTEKGHKRAFTFRNHTHFFQQLQNAFEDQLGTSYELLHNCRQIAQGASDVIHLLPTYTTIQIVSTRVSRGLHGGAQHTSDQSEVHVKIHPSTEMFDHREERTRVGAKDVERQEDKIQVKCIVVPLDSVGDDRCQVECSKEATVEEFLEEAGVQLSQNAKGAQSNRTLASRNASNQNYWRIELTTRQNQTKPEIQIKPNTLMSEIIAHQGDQERIKIIQTKNAVRRSRSRSNQRRPRDRSRTGQDSLEPPRQTALSSLSQTIGQFSYESQRSASQLSNKKIATSQQVFTDLRMSILTEDELLEQLQLEPRQKYLIQLCFEPQKIDAPIAVNKIDWLADLISEQQVRYTYENILYFEKILKEEQTKSQKEQTWKEVFETVKDRIRENNYHLDERGEQDQKIIQFIQEQRGTCLKPLLRSMSHSQKLSIFVLILSKSNDQIQRLFEKLKARGSSLEKQLMDKVIDSVKLKIWQALKPDQLYSLLDCKQEFNSKLWHQIDYQHQETFWNDCSPIQKRILALSLSVDTLIKFMQQSLNGAGEDFLPHIETCKKEKLSEFWAKSTFEMQQNMITSGDKQCLKPLFQALDIETIYHAKIIHKDDLTEDFLLELIGENSLKDLKLFEQFSGTIDHRSTRKEFLDHMKQEQYNGFHCHSFFQKANDNYLQVIVNPNAEGSYLTIEDCVDFPRVNNDTEQNSNQLHLSSFQGQEEIQKIQPDPSRNALKCYQITRYDYMNDKEKDIVGLPLYQGSFLAPNIIPMMNFDEVSKQRELAWLYRGHNSKLFFFNKSAQVGLPQHRGYDAQFPNIYIQVLNDSNEKSMNSSIKSNGSARSGMTVSSKKKKKKGNLSFRRRTLGKPENGEDKRKLVHNCDAFWVKSSDILYHEIVRKEPNAFEIEHKFRLNMIPTLVDGFDGFLDGMLVYSTQTDDEGYGLFFYSLQEQQTFAFIPNAEVFIHCNVEQPNKTSIVYLAGETLFKIEVDFEDAMEKRRNSPRDAPIQRIRALGREETISLTIPPDQSTWLSRYSFEHAKGRVRVHLHKDVIADNKGFPGPFSLLFQGGYTDWSISFGLSSASRSNREQSSFATPRLAYYVACIVTSSAEGFVKDKNKQYYVQKRNGRELQLIKINLREPGPDYAHVLVKETFQNQNMVSAYSFPDASIFDKQKHQTRPALVFNEENKLMGLWIEKETKKLFSLSQQMIDNKSHQLAINSMASVIQERIEYPIAAYSGPIPSQIILCNLADTKSSQQLVHLPLGEELICFISNKNSNEIQLLTKAKEYLVQRKISTENAFQKFREHNLPQYRLDEIRKDLADKIKSDIFDYTQVVKAHRIKSKDVQDALIVQTKNHEIKCIKIPYTKEQPIVDAITIKGAATEERDIRVVLTFKVGSKNLIFWIEQDESDSHSVCLKVFDIEKKEKQKTEKSLMELTKQEDNSEQDELIQIQASAIEEFRIQRGEFSSADDQDTMDILLFDSDYKLHQIQFDMKNKLFITESTRTEDYKSLARTNGSLGLNLTSEQKKMLVTQAGQQKACSFSLDVPGCIYLSLKNIVVFKNLLTQQVCKIEPNDSFFKKKLQESMDSEASIVREQVISAIDATQRQIVKLCYQTPGSKENRFYQVAFPNPNSRMHDLLGALNKQDSSQEVIYFTPNLLLYKICNLDDHQKYWCMLDTSGHIQPLPDIFKERVIKSVRNFCLQDGSIQLMLQDAFKNEHLLQINNQTGAVMTDSKDQPMLDRLKFEAQLKNWIQDKYKNRSSDQSVNFRKGNQVLDHESQEQVEDENSEDIAFKLFGELMCDLRTGHFIQLASIVCKNQPTPKDECPINASVKYLENQHSKSVTTIIFKFCGESAEEDREQFEKAKVTLCGSNLCIWIPGKNIKVIHIAKMLLEKEQREHNLNRSIFRGLTSLQSLDNSQSLLLSEKTGSEKYSNLKLLWQRFAGEKLACCQILQQNVTTKPSEDQPEAILSALDSVTPHMGVKKNKKSVQHVNEERKGCCQKRNLDITNELSKQKVSMLQIALPKRIFLFKLDADGPEMVQYFDQTEQFADPEKFVDLRLQRFSSSVDGVTFTHINASTDKRSFILSDQTGKSSDYIGLLKSHSQMDLQGLLIIERQIQDEEERKFQQGLGLDQSALSLFRGHTVFSIFFEENEFKRIEKLLKLFPKSKTPEDIEESKSSYQLRRLYRILTVPSPVLNIKHEQNQVRKQKPCFCIKTFRKSAQQLIEQKQMTINRSQLYSALERTLLLNSKDVRDRFMKLLVGSNELLVSDFAFDQKSVANMVKHYSSVLHNFLQGSMQETSFTEDIYDLQWTSSQGKRQFVTFTQETPVLDAKFCQDETFRALGKDGVDLTEIKRTKVSVSILDISWLLRDNDNFLKFADLISNNCSERLYQTEFMKILVQEFWNTNFEIIVRFFLIPWVLYFVSTLYFMTSVLDEGYARIPETHTEDNIFKYTVGSLILILLYYLILIEYYQFKYAKSYSEYIGFWNCLDLFQLFSTLYIVVDNMLKDVNSDKGRERMLATFSVFVLWAKIFDWLRLFEPTSFYMRLVYQTFLDMWSFVLIFIVGLGMVGSSMFMLQMNLGNTQGEGIVVVEEFSGNFLLDIMRNQYLLSLGDWENTDFEKHPEWYLCILFFAVATFFSQIVILNMLIAIMGNTFNMVIERKTEYSMQTKLSLLGQYCQVMRKQDSIFSKLIKQKKAFKFLFVVRPILDEEEKEDQQSQEWTGGFSSLRRSITSQIRSLSRPGKDKNPQNQKSKNSALIQLQGKKNKKKADSGKKHEDHHEDHHQYDKYDKQHQEELEDQNEEIHQITERLNQNFEQNKKLQQKLDKFIEGVDMKMKDSKNEVDKLAEQMSSQDVLLREILDKLSQQMVVQNDPLDMTKRKSVSYLPNQQRQKSEALHPLINRSLSPQSSSSRLSRSNHDLDRANNTVSSRHTKNVAVNFADLNPSGHYSDLNSSHKPLAARNTIMSDIAFAKTLIRSHIRSKNKKSKTNRPSTAKPLREENNKFWPYRRVSKSPSESNLRSIERQKITTVKSVSDDEESEKVMSTLKSRKQQTMTIKNKFRHSRFI